MFELNKKLDFYVKYKIDTDPYFKKVSFFHTRSRSSSVVSTFPEKESTRSWSTSDGTKPLLSTKNAQDIAFMDRMQIL